MFKTAFIYALLGALLLAGCAPTEQPQPPLDSGIKAENENLKKRLDACESKKCISSAALYEKSYANLAAISKEIEIQKQNAAELDGLVRFMKNSIGAYQKHIEASVLIANAARFLPVPYAGEVSGFAKAAAKFSLVLNQTTSAIDRFNTSALKYQKEFSELSKEPKNSAKLEQLAKFSDEVLVKDVQKCTEELLKSQKVTAATLSFLQTIANYLAATDDAIGRAKSLLGGNDSGDKSYLSEQTAQLKGKVNDFDARLLSFQTSGSKVAENSKTALSFSMLALELK